MSNSFKELDGEKIFRTLLEIYAEQEGFMLKNLVIEKTKEESNG